VFQGQSVDDGGKVAPDACGEAPQFRQVVGFHRFQPGGQFLAATLSHDLGE
jgi:hypothetical protein